MCETSWEEEKYLDENMSSRIANIEDVEDVVKKFSDAITKACNKSFEISRATTKTEKKTTASNVPIVAINVTSLSLTGNRDWVLCIEYEVFI